MLTLVTSPDCHLCAQGRKVLEQLAARGFLQWRELSTATPEGCALEPTLPPLRPVLLDEAGTVLAYGRLSERRLRRTLGRQAMPTGA